MVQELITVNGTSNFRHYGNGLNLYEDGETYIEDTAFVYAKANTTPVWYEQIERWGVGINHSVRITNDRDENMRLVINWHYVSKQSVNGIALQRSPRDLEWEPAIYDWTPLSHLDHGLVLQKTGTQIISNYWIYSDLQFVVGTNVPPHSSREIWFQPTIVSAYEELARGTIRVVLIWLAWQRKDANDRMRPSPADILQDCRWPDLAATAGSTSEGWEIIDEINIDT